MMREEFQRTARILGNEAMERLANAHVALFGVGGVGSYVAEALIRSGLGTLTIVDSDNVELTNINRQLHALHSTLGQPKVEAMRNRLLDINPEATIHAVQTLYLPGAPLPFPLTVDYIVDAIDNVSAKLELAAIATRENIPIISCMGTGNKLDPTRLQLADIYQTSVCPLCRIMRHELKRRNIPHLRVLYSQEPPIHPTPPHPPASTPFVPATAGLIIASEVVRIVGG